jgi:type IV/VI secretion system ImpK/VasF family protein
MASTTALWFHIETLFTELEEMCVQARAAELVVQKKREEGGRTLRMQGGRLPVEEQTVPLHDGRYPKAEELARDLAFREANPGGPDLVDLRERLRKRLVWLRSRLAEALSEHEVYAALFPLVAYSDELVQSVTHGGATLWEPLQSELYEIDNAGEVFYSMLDERLRQDETLPLIFEIFYFCLNDGFAGIYSHDPKKIEEYKARLATRIPQKPTGELERPEARVIELVGFPWKYYAIAAAVVVAGYAMLSWAAA